MRASQGMPHQLMVVMGQIMGVFGVRGALKVKSQTVPREQILSYRPWVLDQNGEQSVEVVPANGQLYRKGLLVQLAGYTDPDAVRPWVGASILVPRSVLPALPHDQYYWSDLEQMAVITDKGDVLGVVDHLLDNGAQDILVIDGPQGQKMIPFVQGPIVKKVDLANKQLIIDSSWGF